MKNIAFVYTEYQQNILFAICLQEKIQLDVIFIRKNISMHHDIHIFAKKVICFEDVPYSWRSIRKYYAEYISKILPEIDLNKRYLIYAASIQDPLSRLLVNKLKSRTIYLFEDGMGSYLKSGYFNFYFGIKHFLVTAFMTFAIDLISFKLNFNNHNLMKGWSLYTNCFPDLDIETKIISHKCFQKSMMGTVQEKDIVNLKKGSIVFIQQSYVEMSIINEEEYIRIHAEAVLKMKKRISNTHLKIIWKLHPRTKLDDEKRRVEKIKVQTAVEFEIVQEKWNMEHIAYANKENEIQYFSLGSTSLYVIFTLLPKSNIIYLIENEALKEKLPTQKQVNKFYNSINIELI